MGAFCIECEVAAIHRPRHWVAVPRLLVDSGSECTWIPEELLARTGVTVAKRDLAFVMANGQTITRSIGYALLRAQGFETVDEVVLGQPGDLVLLGARTLEGFGAAVDARRKLVVAAGPYPAAVVGRRAG
jgi:predicted aspartyl protease